MFLFFLREEGIRVVQESRGVGGVVKVTVGCLGSGVVGVCRLGGGGWTRSLSVEKS